MSSLQHWLEQHPDLAGIAIVVAGFLLAWVVDFLVSRVMLKLTERTDSAADDEIVRHLHRPIRVTVFVAGLGVASNYFTLVDSTNRAFIWSALKSLVTIIWIVGLIPRYAWSWASSPLEDASSTHGSSLSSTIRSA